MRVRLLQFVEERGIGIEAVARATETQGDLLGDDVDTLLGGRDPGPVMSLAAGGQPRSPYARHLRPSSEVGSTD